MTRGIGPRAHDGCIDRYGELITRPRLAPNGNGSITLEHGVLLENLMQQGARLQLSGNGAVERGGQQCKSTKQPTRRHMSIPHLTPARGVGKAGWPGASGTEIAS